MSACLCLLPAPPPPFKGLIKVTGQTAFFVALFRQASRERLFSLLEAVVPDALPGLALAQGATPAQVGPGGAGRRPDCRQPGCRRLATPPS